MKNGDFGSLTELNVNTNLDLVIRAVHYVNDGTLEPPCLGEIEPFLIFHSGFIDV